ncbi:MAG: MFS transporter [Caulobacterales bacterium]
MSADSDAVRAAELRRGKVGLAMIGAYGSGTVVDSVTMQALTVFLFFYLTIVCGLSGTLAGLSGAVALAIDAIADPLVGSASDNSWSRLGRRHPFMFASIAPLAIALGLLFSVPLGLSGWPLFAYVTAVSIVLRASHSAYFLPYVGLGAELTDDYGERTWVVSSRFVFSLVGGVACLSIGQQLFHVGQKEHLAVANYPGFAWTIAALVLIGGLFTAFATLPALKRLHRVARTGRPVLVQLGHDVVEIFRNPSFNAIFVFLLLLFTGAGVAAVLLLHMLNYFWSLPSNLIYAVTLTGPMGAVIGVPFTLTLTRWVEKRSVVIWGASLWCVLQAALPLMKIAGLLPAAGPLLYGLVLAGAALQGVITVAVAIAFQSAMADAADEHEHLFGTRRESLYYAALNFSAKAATALGVLIAGISTDLIHFPSALAARGGANFHVAPDVLRNLGFIYGPGVAAIYAVGIVIFLGYRLDKRRHAEIQAALAERRRANAGAD